MAQLVFYSERPATSIRSFESPLSEYRQFLKSTSIEAAIWLVRSRFVREKGSFLARGRIGGTHARTRVSGISAVDQPPAAVHDPTVNKSENPQNPKVMNGPRRIQRSRQAQ
jgi:hypothetical protein